MQHAVSSLHVTHVIGALSLHSSLSCMRQTSGSRLHVWDIFHQAASWGAYRDILLDSVWHVCEDFGLFSHDSVEMADKDKSQDTSVSMDTSGLDPDSTAGIQGSTSRVDSTSSSDESSSDGETGGASSGQLPSEASDNQGLTDAQIQALVALGVPKSSGAGDGGPNMSQYYKDISADEDEAAQVAVAEALAKAASDAVEGGIKPSMSFGPKQKQG